MTKKKLIKLDKKTIDNIFEKAQHQQDYVIGLYKIAFPNWSKIKQVHGYPTIHPKTNEYIFGKAIEFDKKHHPNIVNGGLWLNNGFSTIEKVEKEWAIDTSMARVELEN